MGSLYSITIAWWLLAIVVCVTKAQTNNTVNHLEEDDNITYVEDDILLDESNTTSIQFILLGDWGKGGTTGKYGSSFGVYLNDSEEQASTIVLESLRSQSLETLSEKNSTSTQHSGLQPSAGGNNNNGGQKNGGGNGNGKASYQVHIAKAMAAFAASTQPAPSFVVALGDNFYNNGVSSASDILWDYLWKDVYINNYPQLNIPWYPILGNHDYGGGASAVQAQIDRYQAHEDDDIWTFPSTNYTRRFTIPGKDGGSVVIVFVDTTTLAPSVNKCCNQNG
jgi:hypothetical protein